VEEKEKKTQSALTRFSVLLNGENPVFKLCRYLFSGGIGTAVNLGFLYLFVHYCNFHYLTGAFWSFLISVLVSFTLQKFWTFRNFERSEAEVKRQALIFFGVALANLSLNTLLMYFFVDILKLWYMLAQFIAAGLIAISSFFVYRLFVFGNTNSKHEIQISKSETNSNI